MRFRIGTSGYSYAGWKGTFYPKGLPEADMLRHYATQMDTVEINNSFYRMPQPKAVSTWANQTPDHFTFVMKAPRYITPNFKPSMADERGDPIAAFFNVASHLGGKMGPAMVQLAPHYKQRDRALLAAFLDLFPPDKKLVLDLRNPVWFDDAIYAELQARGAAFCVSDADDLSTPVVATARVGYFRLRRDTYTPRALAKWVEKIHALPIDEAFVYFKHEDEGVGPKLAAKLAKVLASG